MPWLGIDYGGRRVGVAVSDDVLRLAHPLETIDRRTKDPLERITALAEEHGVSGIVVGEPLTLDGSRGPAAEKVARFCSLLRKTVGLVPVVLSDERFTTVEAREILHDRGYDTRKSRKVIDQLAAVIILQSFLDEQDVE